MTNIAALLTSVLNAAKSKFGGVGQPAMPDRVYRVHRFEGPTWWGCDLLAVGVKAVRPSSRSPNLPDVGPQRVAVRFIAEIHVSIVRCGAPNISEQKEIPTAAQLDDFAALMAADAQALMDGLVAAWIAKSFGACEDIQFGQLTPFSPQGGKAGWQIVLSITL